MIVVDTSVWIDVLNGVDTEQAQQFRALLFEDAQLALTDVVFTEILQGLRAADVDRVAKSLRAFPVLTLVWPEDFELAANLYRTARGCGVTIRKTLDCLIAAPCVRTGSPLLHSDADFDRLADCTDLGVWS